MKSYLLAFDCSFNEAVLALLDLGQFYQLLNQEIKTESSKKEIVSSLSLQSLEWNNIKTATGFIEKTWDSSSSPHSDQLPLKIKEALEEAFLQEKNSTNLKLSSLNLNKTLKAVAVGAGPGRFTGIRTALSAGKKFSL